MSWAKLDCDDIAEPLHSLEIYTDIFWVKGYTKKLFQCDKPPHNSNCVVYYSILAGLTWVLPVISIGSPYVCVQSVGGSTSGDRLGVGWSD